MATPKYFAAEGSPFSDEDAQRLGPELRHLAEQGASSPEEIVAYAQRHDTPLHEALEMDKPLDEVAQKWYRRRARKVAASIMVRVQTKDGTFRDVRAFHSVTVSYTEPETEKESVKRVYVTMDQVRSSQAMSSQVIDDALERLKKWRDRYQDYRDVLLREHPELEAVFDAVELCS